jgi:hypothetical protein
MEINQVASMIKLSLKNEKDLNEKWIQEYIANDPSVLGLGDLFLRDKERVQPSGGRLDLLFQDQETSRRYEVEIQLGKTDESHIIRTVEYWDIERKRYPQYEHCAVIIAEEITSRFLNVIHLFNGHIPLIAIQMNAYKIDGKLAIIFTKVIDELKLGTEEDDPIIVAADRNYWEVKSSKESVLLAEDIVNLVKEIEPSFAIKYNKPYIGLMKSGIAFNFILMIAKKNFVRLEIKLEKNDQIDQIIEDNELEALEYSVRSNRYKIRITKNDLINKREIIKGLLQKSYDYFND